MKRFTFLFALLSACGGPAFEVQNIAPVEDAGTDSDFNPPVSDVIIPPPDGRAAETGGFESDAGHDVISSDVEKEPDTTPGNDVTPGNDATEADAPNDSWPSDVILVPYCTDPPYPAFSQVCYDWATSHGWTVRACCMPDHTCGTVVGGKCNPA